MLCAFCLQVEQLQAKVVIGLLLIAVKRLTDVTFSLMVVIYIELKLYTTCMYKYRAKASHVYLRDGAKYSLVIVLEMRVSLQIVVFFCVSQLRKL